MGPRNRGSCARADRRRRPLDGTRPRGRRRGRARCGAVRRASRLGEPVGRGRCGNPRRHRDRHRQPGVDARLRGVPVDGRRSRRRGARADVVAAPVVPLGRLGRCSASPTSCGSPPATSTSSRPTRCRSPPSRWPSAWAMRTRTARGLDVALLPGRGAGAAAEPAAGRSPTRPSCGRCCSASVRWSPWPSAPASTGRRRSSSAPSSSRCSCCSTSARYANAAPRVVLIAAAQRCPPRFRYHVGRPGQGRPRGGPLRTIDALTHCGGACINHGIATQ